MADLVLTDRPAERVARVTLNRPERRNALTGPLAEQMLATLDDLLADDELNVVIIGGAGGAFCSGLDLKEFNADPLPDWVPGFGALWRQVHMRLFDAPWAIVGALERAAVNGGAALALACDFLIAGETAFLQVGEVQQGMAAPMNMGWLRLRHDEATAARLALLGDRVAGPELARLGIAFESVADERVVPAALELAERLAAHDPSGIRRIKATMRRSVVSDTAEEWFGRVLASDPLPSRLRPIAAT